MFFELTQPRWPDSDEWGWHYRQGTDKNPGEVLALGPRTFPTEREARSNIATARRAFGVARMAKVLGPG